MINDVNVTLTELVNTLWKPYSLYTLESRAFPSIVDGLKPSQRFILQSAINCAKDSFKKIAEIAGPIASDGYHHGEDSAQSAAILMASPWRNNTPLFYADGFFGSRLVKTASAPRYIYSKLHKNYFDIFKDYELAPDHADEDIKIPKFFLPIIPFVLLNGVEGIATGYRTDILPYDIKDVTKICIDYVLKKNVDNRDLIPKFPEFRGTVERTGPNSYDLVGVFERSGTKLLITDVPYQYDREKYIEVLNKLETDGTILRYDDECGECGFRFKIKLPSNFSKDIVSTFKLRKSVTEIINVIGVDGKIKEYTSPLDLIKEHCDLRLTFVKMRIDNNIEQTKKTMSILESKIRFVDFVLKNKIKFKGKSKRELVTDLTELKFDPLHIPLLLDMNFYHLTLDEIEKMSNKYLELSKYLDDLLGIDVVEEYIKDLKDLYKKLK